MREIKFRYWNGSKVLNQEAIINHLNKYIARNDKHLMQFTGLFDKQGIEIYKGDIVKFKEKYPINDIRNQIGYFIFDLEQLRYKIKCNDGIERYYHLLMFDFEIIGNIYENPELLEGTK